MEISIIASLFITVPILLIVIGFGINILNNKKKQYDIKKEKLYKLKNKIMGKFNGEQTEPIKITSAVEDIIDVIRINETSEVKADLLLVAEDKLKKEEYQRFNAYRIGKIEVITEILQNKSFEIKELFEQLKEIDVMGGDYYGQSMKDFLNKINS